MEACWNVFYRNYLRYMKKYKSPEIPGVDDDYSGLNAEEALERYKHNIKCIEDWRNLELRKIERVQVLWNFLALLFAFLAVVCLLWSFLCSRV